MDPWSIPEFRTGGILGAAAAVALVGVAVLRAGRRPRSPVTLAPVAGGAVAGVAVVAMAVDGAVPVALPPGLGAIALAVALLGDRPWTWRVAGVVPGAVLVGPASLPWARPWVPVLVGLSAAVGAVLVARAERTWGPTALLPVMLAVSVGGVYLTVPDTEEAAALLGVAVPVAVVAWPLRVARLGEAGGAAAVALLCWVAATGGVGRPASIVGGVACVGLLAGIPVARRLVRRRPPVAVHTGDVLAVGQLLLVHLAVVLLASRVSGLRDRTAEAVPIAVVALVAAVALAALFVPTLRRAGEEGPPDARPSRAIGSPS